MLKPALFIFHCVQQGETLPSVELQENTPANKVNIRDLFKGKKGIIFGVPGAYTPTCSNVSHCPRERERGGEGGRERGRERKERARKERREGGGDR